MWIQRKADAEETGNNALFEAWKRRQQDEVTEMLRVCPVHPKIGHLSDHKLN